MTRDPDRPSWLDRTIAVVGLRLPPAEKAVLLMLAYHAGDSWPDAYPKVSLLAGETGLSRSTVLRAIRGLQKRGYVDVTPRYNGRERSVSLYTLNAPVRPMGWCHSDTLRGVTMKPPGVTMTHITKKRTGNL